MKGRVLLLDRLGGREAAALMVDGRLEELALDPEGDMLLAGAICRATPDRPVKGQGGMFLRLPGGAKGFLRQTEGVSPGRPLLVQVQGPAEAGKAVPVTPRLMFKSRFVILTPGAPGLNLSRRLRDGEARARLEGIAREGMAGADPALGLILRSACGGVGEDEVADDLARTRALAEAVLADVAGAPELLVDAPSAHDLAWRDWLDPLPDEVVEREGCFADHGVDAAMAQLCQPRVALEGGGHLWIEPTRALVAVDVNTGADTTPAAGLKASIAAARELPRQLRLRGLGGQVVIDFAPVARRDRHILDQVLKAAFRAEGEAYLAGWTALGLYEMTRKRDRPPLAVLLP